VTVCTSNRQTSRPSVANAAADDGRAGCLGRGIAGRIKG
jgi:hypothetical protein